jgi:hypothetical protein
MFPDAAAMTGQFRCRRRRSRKDASSKHLAQASEAGDPTEKEDRTRSNASALNISILILFSVAFFFVWSILFSFDPKTISEK